MSLVPLKLPPGHARPGTVYDAKGRWYGGNLVRWFNGVMQAWSGWQEMSSSGGVISLAEPIRGMHAWRRNSGAPLLALGTPTKLYVFGTSTLANETPVGFTTGAASAAQTSGAFGTGAFGAGPFGVGDEAEDVLTEANWWQFDNYHEDLVAWAYSDRKIYLYDTSAGSTAALTNAPTNCAGVVVTPENFVVALGPTGVPRRVAWADVDDPTDWTDDPENFAGDLDIKSRGRIVTGRATSRETLIWTDVDLHALRFVGGEFVYGSQQVGTASLISGRAIGVFDDKAVWMGDGSFYLYDGEVKPIPSEVADYVFGDMNRTQASKIHAVVFSKFQTVVWFYPSGTSTECDRYVALNWLGGWMEIGELNRTAGVDSGIYPYPIMADSSGFVYRHEVDGAGYQTSSTSAVVQEFNTTQTATNSLPDTLNDARGFLVTLTEPTVLTAASFMLSKSGTPTGSYSVSLFQLDDDGLPTGAAVVTGSSVADSLTTSATLTETSFTVPTWVPPGTYALVVEYWGSGGVSPRIILGRATGSETTTLIRRVHATGTWVAADSASLNYVFRLKGRPAALPYAESGPVELGNGDNVMDILGYVPDEKTLGDVSLTLYTSYVPTPTAEHPEVENGPYTAANPTTSIRLNGRQMRMKITQVRKHWRFGTPRFDLQPGGLR